MGELPTPTATRLQRPSWRDSRLLVGVILVLLATALGAKVIAGADDTVAMYAAAQTLKPGDRLTVDNLLRVDVQLGDRGAVYLSALTGLAPDRFALREIPRGELVPVGDLGYSGSTFFTTPDGRYLVKSLPRRFEHRFFTHDLFGPYVTHMKRHPGSLLVRITDMPYTPQATLGGILGMAPTHHIVMENLLHGKEEASDPDSWETYDLKPDDYFFPERDIADGRLAPQSVKDRLVDDFPGGGVRVDAAMKRQLLDTLDADTRLLADANAVDYSLFLVRCPGPAATRPSTAAPVSPSPSASEDAWRAGVPSSDGRWAYRAIVLDFFWAKHKFHAQAMTGLVSAFNLVANKGPMSITARPDEYRTRFLSMVDNLVSAAGEGGDGSAGGGNGGPSSSR